VHSSEQQMQVCKWSRLLLATSLYYRT